MANLTALVTLDTTEFAESALLAVPMLKSIGFDRVRLISVVKKGGDRAAQEGYLQRKADEVRGLGVEVETRLPEGDPAAEVLAAAAETDVDLIVLATHGRTGIARLRLGSVGEKLIKEASCPRLVVGPNVDIDLSNYALRRMLIPLDGSELAEMSLPIARYLAGLTGAEVDLIRSVSPTTVVADPAMGGIDLLTPLIEEATAYLARVGETFGKPVNSTVVTGRADDSILEHLKTHPVDLVIMASRGREGIGRALLGSTAERVIQGPDPVLVFEPGEDRSRLFQAARAQN